MVPYPEGPSSSGDGLDWRRLIDRRRGVGTACLGEVALGVAERQQDVPEDLLPEVYGTIGLCPSNDY
jgi:hypothetical protein